MNTLKSILDEHKASLALIIGNGINRYGAASGTNSWYDLLLKLSEKHLPTSLGTVPEGIALTEFFDVLELRAKTSQRSLQQEFCDLMHHWKPYDHHHHIVAWAQQNSTPLLTTNFDSVLAKTEGFPLKHTGRQGFTDFYPWESYYGTEQIENPSTAFGIWHINGMAHYHRSIRLGLTHYMGSAQRARSWIHRGSEGRLYTGKDVANWRGAKTWLHVIFNNPLLIFGLGLDENEVFLRWLLIERARYFRRFPDRKQRAWFAEPTDLSGTGKKLFLEGVGVETVQANSYAEMYEPDTWT